MSATAAQTDRQELRKKLTLEETLESYRQDCIGCGAYQDEARSLRECVTCTTEAMRQACIVEWQRASAERKRHVNA